MTNEQQQIVNEITKKIAAIKDCRLASITYLTKKTKELARYTVILGFSYHNLVEKSITELDILIRENTETWDKITKEAAKEVMASLVKTMEAHAVGEQNEDYTKKDQYIPFGAGLNINTNDNTVQLFGLLQSKVTIEEGVYKEVKSAPLTIAKKKIQKMLPISKFREFALDISNVEKAKVNGELFEVE